MKFVHIADMHFDSPFVNLADKESLGDIRRLDQRKVFKKVIDYVKNNEIEFLFISGDLYEQKYVRESTISYINDLFKEIPTTKIFISPGNHDPYIKNSYYNEYEWNENVKIFSSKIERVELEDIDIYGYGFTDFYCPNCGIEEFTIKDKNKYNVLVMHGSLDSGIKENCEYNPISKKTIKNKGFDYVALGHIHKTNYNEDEEEQNIIYPGSTISLGFDELGKHGMIVGELDGLNVHLEFIPLDETEFKLRPINVSNITSKEELIEKIETIKAGPKDLIEISLIGKRNFEINKYELYKLIINPQIIKIKDQTKINYDLEKLSKEYTLKGLFVKEMMEISKKNSLTWKEKEIIDIAIEMGLDAFK